MRYLVFLLLLVSCSLAHAQPAVVDSLREVYLRQPDSVRAATALAIVQAMRRTAGFGEDWAMRIDAEAISFADEAIRLGSTYRDTLTWKSALAFRYQYLNSQEDTTGTRQVEKEIQRIYSAYGLELDEEFGTYNEFNGYQFTSIRNTISILKDTTGLLDFDAVRAADSLFQTNDTEFEDFVGKDPDYWVRLRLRGNPDKDGEYLFMVGQDSYTWKYIEVFIPDGKGGFNIQKTGLEVPLAERPLPDWQCFFTVFVPREGDKTLYLHLRDAADVTRPPGISLRYMNESYLRASQQRSSHNNGIFVGILWIQGIYFLLLFLSVRERVYLYYTVYLAGLALFVMNSQYFPLAFPQLAEYAFALFYVAAWVAGFGMIKFAEWYLNVRVLMPRWRRANAVFLVLLGINSVSALAQVIWAYPIAGQLGFMPAIQLYNLTIQGYLLLIPVGVVFLLVMGIVAYRKAYKPALYYLLAIALLILGLGGVPLTALLDLDIISFEQAVLLIQVSIVLQLSLFALGVGNKQKQLENERREALEQSLAAQHEANTKLRQADRMKDEFLANTSHELRTPLNGIIGISESLFERAEDAEPGYLRENLSVLIASGKRLSNLVNDILDFSKLKNTDIELQQAPLDMRMLTDSVLRVSKSLAGEKAIHLKNEIDPDAPAVLGDENRVQQILYNLIGNALKFTHEGEILVAAHPVGDMLEIAVSDTGIGIAEEKQEAIFRSFEQGDGSTAREYGGTGLGLSITRQLVELHGGTIRVASAPGKGATFTFTLPLAPAESEVERTRILPKEITAPATPVSLSPQTVAAKKERAADPSDLPIHILVVDDEPINQQVLKNHLAGAQYRITAAMNGEDALEAIASGTRFDLVLLDIMMPRMSGYEVCQHIRKKYLPSELPVIMITAKNQVEDLVAGLEHGANDYITKPFSRQEFLARVRTHLNLFQINTAYGRFIPHEFLHSLGRNSILDVKLGDQVEKEVTVFFSDIRAYTSLAESMRPTENFRFVNAYAGRMGPIIKAHRGFVNQYLGDGIMAIFRESPEDALRAAISMQEEIQRYNLLRLKKDWKPLRIGMGMHTGSLIMGIIGDDTRTDAATISDSVNTAARMEGLTKYYGASILLSEGSFVGISSPSAYLHRFLGRVQVKGKQESLGIYEFFGGDMPEVRDLKQQTQADFAAGLAHYFDREFAAAAVAFNQVLRIHPTDIAAQRYLAQAAKYLVEGSPEDWTGVEMMTEK